VLALEQRVASLAGQQPGTAHPRWQQQGSTRLTRPPSSVPSSLSTMRVTVVSARSIMVAAAVVKA
jgi:hypothetical protein